MYLIAACLWGGFYLPSYILLAYYTLKIFFPASKWPWMRHHLCINHTPYCNSQTIVFEDGAAVPQDKSKVMLAVAPHGILTLGWSFLITSREFEFVDCKWLTTEILLWLPFISDFLAWGDCMSCTSSVMHRLMRDGINIGLIPGGFEEATLYQRGKHQIYIKNRKGFIKYGYSIQPAYVFGEELTFWTVSVLPSLMLWLNRFHIPGTVFMGRYLFMPDNDIDVTVVVGKPIALPQIDEPTTEDINKYHELYITTMTSLFDKYKEKYAFDGKKAVLELLVDGKKGSQCPPLV